MLRKKLVQKYYFFTKRTSDFLKVYSVRGVTFGGHFMQTGAHENSAKLNIVLTKLRSENDKESSDEFEILFVTIKIRTF
jgi:hypothetical protein